MTARIFGALGKHLLFGNILQKKNNQILKKGKAEFGVTSNFSLNYYAKAEILAVADWNVYGEIRNLESFVEAYKKKGIEKVLSELKGEFAIALYNAQQDKLYLARDPIGYKPLYYVANERRLAFASHANWLTNIEEVNDSLNHQTIALFAGGHYRYIDNSPTASFFQDIQQLPAMSYLTYQCGSEKVSTYRDLNLIPLKVDSITEVVEEYKLRFIYSVRQRLQAAEGKKCFLLSGGMDSSSVLATSVYLEGNKQEAFSTVYVDKTYDESEDIQIILEDYVSKWHPQQIDAVDIFDITKKMVIDNEGPVATATWLAHYLLYEEISKQGFTEVFGGLGGDELNAGEFEHFLYFFGDLKVEKKEPKLAHEVACWIKHHDHPIFKKNFQLVEKSLDKLINKSNPGEIYFDKEKYSRYYNAVDKDFFDLTLFEPFLPQFSKSYLNNKTLSDVYYETIPCCLRANDRHDFRFGIKTHFPFFDINLLEFAHKIPAEYKTKDGITKIILREAMSGILPESTRTRIKKTGWNAPFHIWMLQKQNKENLIDLIHSQTFKERGIYNLRYVEKLLREHFEIMENNLCKENHMMFFWQLMNLELWLQSIKN